MTELESVNQKLRDALFKLSMARAAIATMTSMSWEVPRLDLSDPRCDIAAGVKPYFDRPLGRSPSWGPGEWDDDKHDYVVWEHVGYHCEMRRNYGGVWCGYVTVPYGHVLCGHRGDGLDLPVYDTAGVFATGNHWEFAFDCGHDMQIVPRDQTGPFRSTGGYAHYVGEYEAKCRTEELAEAIAAFSGKVPMETP